MLSNRSNKDTKEVKRISLIPSRQENLHQEQEYKYIQPVKIVNIENQDPKWSELKVDGKNINHRAQTSITIHNDFMYLYGGYQVQLGIMDEFNQKLSYKDNPGPRTRHLMCTYTDRIYIFDGQIHQSISTNQMWYFDLNSHVCVKCKINQSYPPEIDNHTAVIHYEVVLVYILTMSKNMNLHLIRGKEWNLKIVLLQLPEMVQALLSIRIFSICLEDLMVIKDLMIYGSLISKPEPTYYLAIIFYLKLDLDMLCWLMMKNQLFLVEQTTQLGNQMTCLFLILRKWNGLVLMKIVLEERINNYYLLLKLINKIYNIHLDNLENLLEMAALKKSIKRTTLSPFKKPDQSEDSLESPTRNLSQAQSNQKTLDEKKEKKSSKNKWLYQKFLRDNSPTSEKMRNSQFLIGNPKLIQKSDKENQLNLESLQFQNSFSLFNQWQKALRLRWSLIYNIQYLTYDFWRRQALKVIK